MASKVKMKVQVVADVCACENGPLEFTRGWCTRCGRLLEVDVVSEHYVDGWIMLWAAVERARLRMMDEAEEQGIDVDDEDAFRAWAERRLADSEPMLVAP